MIHKDRNSSKRALPRLLELLIFDRLTTETVTGGAGPNYAKTFTYDAVGNRLKPVTTGTGAVDLAYTYESRDRLPTEGGVTYSWDHNGNLVGKAGSDQYQWDFEDRLVKVTKADGTVVEHVYDVDGNRVSTTVTPTGGQPPVVTNFLVDTTGDLSQVVVETDETGAVKAYYIRAGNDLLGVRRGNSLAGYLKDGLGSVRELLDMTGTVTDSRDYTAFGEVLNRQGEDNQPY